MIHIFSNLEHLIVISEIQTSEFRVSCKGIYKYWTRLFLVATILSRSLKLFIS